MVPILDEQTTHTDKQDLDTSTLPQRSGRTIRSASVSTAMKLLEYNPAGGMWQATGTAIAHAPNSSDLRSPYEVDFNAHGRSVRRISTQDEFGNIKDTQVEQVLNLPWTKACKNGFLAEFKFLCTPTSLFIAIYGLNVVAWSAMLFFLLLNVSTMSAERKEIWIEIDSQILNGLFCLTSWGLAPWRVRDTYWLLVWRLGSEKSSNRSINQLVRRNVSWFRIINSCVDEEAPCEELPHKTSTGNIAPPTSSWKMDFVVINMLLNSLFQIGMATFMWQYNRHNRPSFGVGLFIGLGCLSSLFAGVMSWWEGRKVKKIEGPILEEPEKTTRMEVEQI
ncbi:hypothetical protein N7533_006187 [Penicillium manginii]|uniref:uncharacterized protein n=1 Tax=Penicillium manginii TaxID=203109 RepID=UPI00254864F8|nr:uncharacterized protein N7533_006187 [Penicillium manginii]KAJ5756644.1 hypothetical protein N7533_006187 [Penicillium manginii]